MSRSDVRPGPRGPSFEGVGNRVQSGTCPEILHQKRLLSKTAARTSGGYIPTYQVVRAISTLRAVGVERDMPMLHAR
jgi:hypothetical protein